MGGRSVPDRDFSSAAQADRLRSFPGPAGYGIAFGCIDGCVGHTGELPGYNTTVCTTTPPASTTVIVQANSDSAAGDCPVAGLRRSARRVCSSPATRIFVALSTACYTFTPIPRK